VKEEDANKEALEQVLESEELKRKLADSKKRITADNTARP